MRTPSNCYYRSPREFPYRLPPVSYPEPMAVRRVRPHGDIYYQGRRLFVTESLAGDYVGLESIDEDTSLLWYCRYVLGRLDHRRWLLVPAEPNRLSVQLAGQISPHQPGNVLPMSSIENVTHVSVDTYGLWIGRWHLTLKKISYILTSKSETNSNY